MNGAQYLLRFLERKGVDLVFGYPGGKVIFLYDALASSKLRHILARHEQGAVHAAEGYAQASGKPGVCFATSGPGATNLVTGIADAHQDSVPLFLITGQVGLGDLGRDAFQEADITGIATPVTKHTYLIRESRQLPDVLEEAWQVMITGRPGPVLVDIPSDIFVGQLDFPEPGTRILTRKIPMKHRLMKNLPTIVDKLNQAERPLILAGGGVVISGVRNELLQLMEKMGMPAANTLKGKGACPETHPLALGMAGMHGRAAANLAMKNCDLLLAVGARFSDRVTGNPKKFLTDTFIVHVDLDIAELGKNVHADIGVAGDARTFLNTLLNRPELKRNPQTEAWNRRIQKWEAEFPDDDGGDYEGLKSQEIIREAARQAGPMAVVVTDVGQQQMFAAQNYPTGAPRCFITSGGLGTMGFGLPAAAGAALGRPGENVLLFAGDGGFQMTSQEMAVLREHNLPVKIFLMNNGVLGMVYQWQALFYKENYSQTVFERNPDFVKLAEAYGIPAFLLDRSDQAAPVIRQALDMEGPVLMDCRVDPRELVLPMIPAGGTLEDMMGRWRGEAHISRISGE
jgi:acetolactate synthase-1/2/3 large subunit